MIRQNLKLTISYLLWYWELHSHYYTFESRPKEYNQVKYKQYDILVCPKKFNPSTTAVFIYITGNTNDRKKNNSHICREACSSKVNKYLKILKLLQVFNL